MKVGDFFVFIFLFIALGAGLYVLWLYLPGEAIPYAPVTQVMSNNGAKGLQFYPNMRYRDSTITYYIEPACDESKSRSAAASFDILSQRTVLNFIPSSQNPEIRILCSQIAPGSKEQGHFVAGEGGPSEIINTSSYSVIFTGKVALYRSEKCDTPHIALHEILHALGFDHIQDPHSVMYPITSCDQELDQSIVDEINRLYSIPSKADLGIEHVNANTTGRYLNFDITLGNFGLKDASGVKLSVSAGDNLVREFDLYELPIGTRKFLNVENVRIQKDAPVITFSLSSSDGEISYGNNNVTLSLV
ncbi:matrixin family metalloprotease [Candidatus Pacearchaeota archaeon]|nr:matrixin family metalloprotease [Candidatus Pacearchaeota archaeon]